MKALHKVIDLKHLAEQLHYIQIKGGYAYTSDGYVAIKTPVEEIFDCGVVSDNEELYFHANEWRVGKMDKAVAIEREGLLFTAYDRKGQVIGRAQAIAKLPDDLIFPDVDSVMPNDQPVVSLGLAANGIGKIRDAFGFDHVVLEATALNKSRGMRVRPIDEYNSKATAIIMPLADFFPTYHPA